MSDVRRGKGVHQTRDELIGQLREQLAAIEASSAGYDAGHHWEAKRLAVTLRVLLHDTKRAYSLLETLSIKKSLRLWEVMHSAARTEYVHMGVAMENTEKGLRWLSNLNPPHARVFFTQWWNGSVLWNADAKPRVEFSRKSAILGLADMDGGAHVDSKLEEAYFGISRQNAFGWDITLDNGEAGIVENNPALAIVRTAAHEVHGTLMEQLPKLLPEWK